MKPQQDTQRDIKSLHATYCQLSGRHATYGVWERLWYDWAGYFGLQDLVDVLEFIKSHNSRRDYQFSLRLEKLLDPQHFDSLLSEARATKRTRVAVAQQNSPANVVVREFRRVPQEPKPAQTQVAATVASKLLEGLKKSAE